MHRNFIPASWSESVAGAFTASFAGAGAGGEPARLKERSVAIRGRGRGTADLIVFSGARDPDRNPQALARRIIVASRNPDPSLVEGASMRVPRGPVLLAAAVGLLIVAVFTVAPREQPQDYHLFADTAPLGGVPNALNVLSNLAFLAAGIWGLAVVLSPRATIAFTEPWLRGPWTLFFAAIAATALGSTLYHWNPDDATLFWDRLPMTVAFTALATAVLAERVDSGAASRLFVPLVAAGLAAIVAWRITGDLRPYIALQASAILVVLATVLFFAGRPGERGWMIGLLAGYGAALVFEIFDHEVKAVLGFTGGHPLKHLAAAAGTACLVAMLNRRTPAARL
jgi:hypothetical protein